MGLFAPFSRSNPVSPRIRRPQVSVAAQEERAYASSVVERTLLLIALLTVGILSVTGLLLFSTYRSIARPIGEMVALARRTADGDLTCGFDLRRRDEIGALAVAFGSMRENLKGMIVRIRTVAADISAVSVAGSQTSARAAAAVQVQKEVIAQTDGSIRRMDESFRFMTEKSEQLLRSSENAAATVWDMTDSIGEVVRDAETFGTMQDSTTESVIGMITAIREGAQSIGELAVSSEEMVGVLTGIDASVQSVQEKAAQSVRLAEEVSREAAERGLPSITAAVRGMEEVRSSVGSLTDSILELDRRSAEIGRILSVIDEVADQTQLLSLNAAIIAAQAGEKGRGFGVVAEEIKSLAQKTSVSTREVAELIRSIQEHARASAARSKEGLAAVERGLPLVQEASRAFQSIHASSRSSTGMSRAIEEMTSEQALGIHEVALQIQKMASRIRQISSSAKARGEEGQAVLSAVESMKSALDRVIEAMARQAGVSRKISQVCEEVAHHAQEIGSDISGQRERNSEIVKSAESLRQT